MSVFSKTRDCLPLFDRRLCSPSLTGYTVVRPLFHGEPDQSGGAHPDHAKTRASAFSWSRLRRRCLLHLLQPAAAQRNGRNLPLPPRAHRLRRRRHASRLRLRPALLRPAWRCARAPRAHDAALRRSFDRPAPRRTLSVSSLRHRGQHPRRTLRLRHPHRPAHRA